MWNDNCIVNQNNCTQQSPNLQMKTTYRGEMKKKRKKYSTSYTQPVGEITYGWF